MSYDMKRIRQAVDGQIPPARADEARLMEIIGEAAGKRQRRPARWSGLLSAAAAVIVMILTFLSILPDGPGRDHVGGPLSMGNDSMKPTAAPVETMAPEPTAGAAQDEDMSLYMAWYSPDWGESMFPDEAEFGDVVIRKQEDGSFAFENQDGSEALPGRWQQAFAWFVTSGTGLVGNGEAMALLGKDGLITDFIYESLEYMGNRAAFVQMSVGSLSGLTLISVADGEYLNGKFYDEIGYTGDGKTRLFMGVRREMIRLEDGGMAPDKILYTDVMDTTGRIIVRCHELCHVYEGILGVRREETGDILLLDMEGNELYGGRTFGLIGDRKNGLQIVHEAGVGVLDADGGWLIDPGVYAYIRFGENDTLLVTDYKDITREITYQGEDVSSASLKTRMWLKKTLEKINSWLDSFGLLGKIILLASAWFLIVRLGHARTCGETRHMLVTEAGWAALIFALLLISHRSSWNAISLWPTDTDTSGSFETAWAYGILASGGLISMIGCRKRMRKPARALIAGAAVLLIPWAIKWISSDMSVKDWRVLSGIVFTVLPLLSVLLMKARFARRFLAWCNTLDTLNEYGRWRRIVWYALTLAAFANFAIGTYLSGQDMNGSSLHTEILPGGGTAYDAAWIAEINETSAKRRASGEEITDSLNGGNWAVIQTVRWMEANNIERLTGDMLYCLSVEGTVELKREGMAQMYFTSDAPGVRFLTMNSPTAKDGQIHADSVILVPPDMEPLPEISATISVSQPKIDWIASQHYYEVSLDNMLHDMGGAEGAQQLLGAADTSEAVIGGADAPTSIFVEENSRSEAIVGGADAPTSILVK